MCMYDVYDDRLQFCHSNVVAFFSHGRELLPPLPEAQAVRHQEQAVGGHRVSLDPRLSARHEEAQRLCRGGFR